jgi:predicted nucleic acid-binding protein
MLTISPFIRVFWLWQKSGRESNSVNRVNGGLNWSDGWSRDLRRSFANRLLPVTDAIAERWAVLSAQMQRRSTPLAAIDGLIAATALEPGLTMATRNVKDFFGLSLQIFNPWES